MKSSSRTAVLDKFAELPLDAQNRLVRKIKAIEGRPASSPLLTPQHTGPLLTATLNQRQTMSH